MAGPWEKYAPQAEAGPWTKYGSKEPAMSTTEDVARSAGSGARNVVESTLGMVGDLRELPRNIAMWGMEKLGAPPEATERLRDAKLFPTMPGLDAAPTTEDIRNNVTDPLIGDALKHEPQTIPGKFTQTGVEFLPAAFGNRASLFRRAAQVAVPAASSETAGEIAHEIAPEYEPWVRAAAAIFGGGAVAATSPRTAAQTVSRAVEGATPQQMTQAEALFQQAQRQGTPITRLEAVQQVTSGGTRAGDIQRVVEGQGGLRDFMAPRPAQNEAAARQTFDTITPPTPAPSTIGPAVGREAEGVVTDVRQKINDITEPMYKAAEPKKVDAATFQRIQQAPGWKEARKAVRSNPQLGRYVKGMPDDSVGFLNEVQKYLRQQGDNAAGPMNAQRNQQISAGYGTDATTVRQAAEQASPEFAQAVQVQADLRQRYLDPLLQGPIGKIASKDTGTQDAINALFPRNPLPNSQGEIGRTVGLLAKRNPYAARQLVRAHIESTFNQASKELQSGANQFGGAGFRAKLVGNPQQAANLEASIRALPNGDDLWKGFDRFLEVMEAQGQRQRIGSQTAFNQEALKDLSGGSALGTSATLAAGGGLQIPSKVRDVVERWRLGRNVDEIARLITDPQGARVFRELATQEGVGVRNQVIRLLFLAKAGSSGSANSAATP